VSAYRDRPLSCPRCTVELVRTETRDCWRCSRCNGLLVGIGEVIDELVEIAPDLMPAAGARSITTLGRGTTAALVICATCGAPMEPVFLGGVDVDRCYHDEQIWFDGEEHALVMQRATAQREARASSGWLSRLLAKLAGP
jgi:Zn-finger nucleic acid-binding protein